MSTSFQLCFWIDMTSQHRTASNQRGKNVVYINVEICNVDLNKVRQRRNNIVILNIDFHNLG